MSLRLYDTAARAVRDFTPLRAGRASVYVCGLTVQGPPHVGHVRAALGDDADLTDDAAVVRAAGVPVATVAGDERAAKVTVPHDLALAELLVRT